MSNARDALARMEAGECFDVIFCDVNMPEVTRPDVVEQLGRELPDEADKVVFIAGCAFAGRSRDSNRARTAKKLEADLHWQAKSRLVAIA